MKTLVPLLNGGRNQRQQRPMSTGQLDKRHIRALSIGYPASLTQVEWPRRSRMGRLVDTGESKSVFRPEQPVKERQENVEVLLWPTMVRQMMGPAGTRHPPSVVCSQVDLYSHYDIG